jgi:hypothetical protein
LRSTAVTSRPRREAVLDGVLDQLADMIMASAVASSARTRPKLPVRRGDRCSARGHLHDRADRRTSDVVEVDRLVEPWLRVSCTSAIVPTRRTASSSAARAPRRHPPGLEAQQRGHRLQVVLHPVVDLADGRVLGQQLLLAAAQLADVAASTIAPMRCPAHS